VYRRDLEGKKTVDPTLKPMLEVDDVAVGKRLKRSRPHSEDNRGRLRIATEVTTWSCTGM